MGFARRVCNTNAKLAIKQNDKQEFDGDKNEHRNLQKVYDSRNADGA